MNLKRALSLFIVISVVAFGRSALAVTSSLAAVSPDASATEAFRKVRPEAAPPRPFHLRAMTTYKLSNGLEVELVEDHRVPFITAAIGFKFGSTSDPASLHGLSELTATMLLEGTKTSRQIANEVEVIGGALKCVSESDYTILSGSALSKYTDRLFASIDDVLLNPAFPQDELTLRKINWIQELKLKRSEPEFLLEEQYAKVVFGKHPYSIVAPAPESVEKITADDLAGFHKSHFIPNQAVLVVVGDFNSEDIKKVIAQDFGEDRWKPGTLATLALESAPALTGRRLYIVDRPDSVQSSIKIGNLAIKRSDADFFPLMVADQILGGGAQSRLFLNLREQKGLTYGAYSHMEPNKDPGDIAASADVRTDVTGQALHEFLYELDRIREGKLVDASELQNAKSYLTGSFQLGLETQAGLAQRLLEVKIYDLPSDYIQTYAANVEKITASDVRSAAQKWINPNDVTIVVVGDATKIEKGLEQYGSLEVLDVNGKIQSGSALNPAKVQPGL